jgi:hypothetical protein
MEFKNNESKPAGKSSIKKSRVLGIASKNSGLASQEQVSNLFHPREPLPKQALEFAGGGQRPPFMASGFLRWAPRRRKAKGGELEIGQFNDV